MPLMIEPLVMQPHTNRAATWSMATPTRSSRWSRLAREMGADIVKADPTDNAEDFHRVVEAARCPVLVRGGGKEDLRAVFDEFAPR